MITSKRLLEMQKKKRRKYDPYSRKSLNRNTNNNSDVEISKQSLEKFRYFKKEPKANPDIKK